MLSGIDPLLTGTLLAHLDAMGHADAVLVADAHFPAARYASRLVELPGHGAPTVLAAIRTVLPLDDTPSLDLLRSLQGDLLPVQADLLRAADLGEKDVRLLERQAFYELSASAFVIVRTGEARPFGNALLRKGLIATRNARPVSAP